jgi:hypothetical protein
MDFVNFSHYFNSHLNIRKAIFVASALITPFLKKLCFGIKGGIRVIELEVSWDGPNLTYHYVEVKLDMTLW